MTTISSIFKIEYVYYVVGIFLFIVAALALMDKKNPRRITTALFWGIFGFLIFFGKFSFLKPLYTGYLVLAMAILAGVGGVFKGKYNESTQEQKETSAKKLNLKLFIPILLIPLITILGSFDKLPFKKMIVGDGVRLLEDKQETFISLGIACVVALIVAMLLTRSKPYYAAEDSRRLVDAISWAAVLPQFLAMLGGVFTAAKVDKVISDLATDVIPTDSKFWVVVAYCLGMALFTMIMGNAFAAFPVMTAAIGLPFIVMMHGGNPAVVAAIGMFSGYCGTLMTPMGANFNIVPAALLDLHSKNDVIKVQIPTALTLLTVNVFLMYIMVY